MGRLTGAVIATVDNALQQLKAIQIFFNPFLTRESLLTHIVDKESFNSKRSVLLGMCMARWSERDISYEHFYLAMPRMVASHRKPPRSPRTESRPDRLAQKAAQIASHSKPPRSARTESRPDRLAQKAAQIGSHRKPPRSPRTESRPDRLAQKAAQIA